MRVGTTTVTVNISCSSASSPGVDTPSKEGPIIICFSVGYTGDKKDIQEFCIPVYGYKPGPDGKDKKGTGDTAVEAAPRAAEAAGGTTPGASGVPPQVAITDPLKEFTVTFYGATHVDAYSNYGKIRFGGSYTPPPPGPTTGGGGGGGPTTGGGGTGGPTTGGGKTESNPPGLGLKPPEVVNPPAPTPGGGFTDKSKGGRRPICGGGLIPWPEGTPGGRTNWDSWLKNVKRKEATEQIGLHSRGGSQQCRAPGPAVGEIAVGYVDGSMAGAASARVLRRVPFLYSTSSIAAQLEEIASRLEAADIAVEVRNGLLVPVWIRDLDRAPTVLEFWTASDPTGAYEPFPWTWYIEVTPLTVTTSVRNGSLMKPRMHANPVARQIAARTEEVARTSRTLTWRRVGAPGVTPSRDFTSRMARWPSEPE